MPTSIIASGSTEASSSDITLTDGAKSTIFAFDSNGGEIRGPFRVALELRDAAGNYTSIDYLTQGRPALQIVGPGTWRARRLAEGTVGVCRD